MTGLENIYLEQLKAFGDPDRFPLGRVITVGYYALVEREDYNIKAGFTSSEAKWFNIKDISGLMHDHDEILEYSLGNLRKKLGRLLLALAFCQKNSPYYNSCSFMNESLVLIWTNPISEGNSCE